MHWTEELGRSSFNERLSILWYLFPSSFPRLRLEIWITVQIDSILRNIRSITEKDGALRGQTKASND